MTAPDNARRPVRISTAKLRQLAADLTPRYTTPLTHLARARLLTGAHLDRLLTEPDLSSDTTSRVRRRIMNRLRGARLVAALDRRIGGARAGSAGHVYTLTPAGHAFLAVQAGQPRPTRIHTPLGVGAPFLAHALAIAEIYVQLIERTTPEATLAIFATEPACWYPDGTGAWLRPDAYTVLHGLTHAECWWIEVDQDTESLPRLRTKLRSYVDYLHHGDTGPDQVPPRVLFTTPTSRRYRTITDLLAGIPYLEGQHFDACIHAHAGIHLIAALLDQIPAEDDR
jgi:Replication-relaxation